MKITNTGEVYLGEFDEGKQTGDGYCYRSYETYEVQKEVKATAGSANKIPAYVTSATYEGELLDNEHSGYGVMITLEDRKYEGYWLNNQMHGKGKFTDEFGSTFDGHWQQNMKGSNDKDTKGHGVSIQLNGDKFY